MHSFAEEMIVADSGGKCGQAQCAYQARAAVKSCDTTQRSCRCSPEFRGMTAGCVALNCNVEEINRRWCLEPDGSRVFSFSAFVIWGQV